MANILVIGCGNIGFRLASALTGDGHCVTALKRTPLAVPAPFALVLGDIAQPSTFSSLAANYDLAVLVLSASGRNAEQYRALYQVGLNNVLNHFAAAGVAPPCLMVSSTSVYGQNGGEWVDEDSPTQPASATAEWLVKAEQRLWQAGPHNCVVRFSGIYGPGRDWLLRRAAAGEAIQRDPPNYTNRIHQDDCLAVLLFLIGKMLGGTELDKCYLASDNDPAPLWDVMVWIAAQFGYPPPKALPPAIGVAQNKRCSNARLNALGYRWRYPSYRDGYLPPYPA
ncbi:NAD-dependent epimerase/dehydratase family protein [Methylomonas koyamae]|uniref:NAD(P)-dependent oxidoreductase n=1 Tax=Methylomonas koyamae TaxID=702114 RepID=A0AA91DG03_9GAMM|nr:NAD-dependent epimerase/dehydratase family protein [Methylomonas koyamae]OAI28592.1 NAD(P)-dependent oxidoreductase [Methylomonas koyamae]